MSAVKYHFNVCCAAIWLHDVHNVTVKGIILTVLTANVSGIILRNVSGVSVQLTTTYSSYDHYCLGIAIYEADSVDLQLSSAYNCTYGVAFRNTSNGHINDITATHNIRGVVLLGGHDNHISNTNVAHNHYEGMSFGNTDIIHIANTTAAYNGIFGMHLWNMSNTYISYTTATHNGEIGMYVDTMNDAHITSTTASHNHWNGMKLGNMNNTYITSTTATHNGREGVFLCGVNNSYITNTTAIQNGWEGMLLYKINNTCITNTTLTLNGWDKYHGSVMSSGQVVIILSTYTQINDSSFTDVEASTTATTADPNSQPAIIVLYQSTLHISECHFTGNHISAIRGDASNITVSGILTFSSNKAFAGTAFILSMDSVLSLAEKSHVYFLNNRATNIGGVFYVVTDMYYIVYHLNVNNYENNGLLKNTKCFLHIEGSRSQERLTFVNNSAAMGGDILYGGDVAFGLDGEWNCLDSFKNISNISQNGLSLISSDPSRVCLCNGTGQPDCLTLADPTPHSLYPGQSINISAVVVGQDFGTVAGSVYAQFLHTSSEQKLPQLELGSWQKVQAVTQHNCSNLHYTIFSQSGIPETALVLTAHDSYVSRFITNISKDPNWVKHVYHTTAIGPLLRSTNPVYINISLLSCPPGFMLTTHSPFRCDCILLLQQMQGIQCYIQDQTISRSGLQWVGMIQDHNITNKTVVASKYCPLDYCNQEESNVTLSKPDSQCNYNHSGILCGRCQPGLSLALGSAQCLPCSNKYLALLIPFTLAGPILVGVIKLLDLTISQGAMNGLIFYANIVRANEYIFLPQRQIYPLTVFIAWLNLDLGVETCFFDGLSAYLKTWLQFVFPLYIWSIAGLIIILAKYSDRVASLMGNNSVPILATLFLLSYAKIFRTIIAALSYTVVYTSHGHKAVWTADGNVEYLGSKHAPLFAVAMAMLLLWLLYTLLLFLGQWLHMCNCQPISCVLIRIKPFLDAHYGPLKGKHRYWFGTLLLVRAVILLIQALVPADHTSTMVLCISVFAIILTYYGQFVYRNLAVSAFNTAFYMNLALLSGINCFSHAVGEDPSLAAYILIGAAFVQFVGLILFKVFSILKQNERAIACLHKGRPVEEDWEVYEQAALLREMESDTEEQDSEDAESIESLPTY